MAEIGALWRKVSRFQSRRWETSPLVGYARMAAARLDNLGQRLWISHTVDEGLWVSGVMDERQNLDAR